MIPLKDRNPTTRTPWVTIALIALNVIAFLFWEPIFGHSNLKQQLFFFCHAEIPWEVTHQTALAAGGEAARHAIDQAHIVQPGAAPAFQAFLAQHCLHKSWWESVFVAMFLHGGWLHIGGNMLYLWIFGNNVEDKIGPFFYLVFYLLGGIAATALQTATDANSVVPNLGASGAIAAVLGAYLVMFPRRRVLTLIFFFFIMMIELPAIVLLGFWFLLQFFSGATSLTQHIQGGVAYFAHVGGFVFGLVVAFLLFPKERRVPPEPRPVW